MEIWQLQQRQAQPLDIKIKMTEKRIREFYDHFKGEVYVAFSGGKDSTVMLDLVGKEYSDVPAVFIDTGLEYPEIREFVKTIDNVTWLKPQMGFKKVLEKYGFPVISKEVSMAISRYRNTKDPIQKEYRLHGTKNGVKIGVRGVIPEKWKFLLDAPFKISERCCDIMKKNPAKKFHKKIGLVPFVGTMACDSRNRKMDWLKRGCNVFDSKIPQSRPLSFWTEEDIWGYLKRDGIPYCKVYDMGEKHTGCIFCMFGCHMEKEPNRFQRMAVTHPKLWNYCINKLGLEEVMDYINSHVKNLSDRMNYNYIHKLEDFK